MNKKKSIIVDNPLDIMIKYLGLNRMDEKGNRIYIDIKKIPNINTSKAGHLYDLGLLDRKKCYPFFVASPKGELLWNMRVRNNVLCDSAVRSNRLNLCRLCDFPLTITHMRWFRQTNGQVDDPFVIEMNHKAEMIHALSYANSNQIKQKELLYQFIEEFNRETQGFCSESCKELYNLKKNRKK